MVTEATFWRSIAVTLGTLILLCVTANSLYENLVPHSITLGLFGTLVAIGVGYSIVCPRLSPVLLALRDEEHFRKKQYAVGFVFSIAFALLMLVKDVRQSALVWLFIPFVILPFALVVREKTVRGRLALGRIRKIFRRRT